MPRTPSAPRLAVALAVTALLPPLLAGCGGGRDDEERTSPATHAVAAAPRSELVSGSAVTWGVDAVPATLNAHHRDATPVTDQVAAAVMPMLFTLDEQGSPRLNPDYLRSAEVTATEPRQQVVYTLNPQARWSDGTPLSAADFRAQWRALSGGDPAFEAATAAGYERVASVTEGPGAHQVTVTFATPCAEWRALFSPLYPRAVTGDAERFNDGAAAAAERPPAAGPFRVRGVDREDGTVTLERNPDWWGSPALLDELVFAAVPPGERRDALLAGDLDVAAVPPADARSVTAAHAPPSVPQDGAALADAPRAGLRGLEIYRAYGPESVHLILNGTAGPLADERVRWAVARALDRQRLARDAHAPAGLPAQPLGSHLHVLGQDGYRDNSEALGETGTRAASELLDEAGWRLARPGSSADSSADDSDDDSADDSADDSDEGSGDGNTGDAKAAPPAMALPAPLTAAQQTTQQRAALLHQAAQARRAQAAASGGDDDALAEARRAEHAAEEADGRAAELARHAAGTVRARDGEPLTLRFLVPSGSGQLRDTARQISAMLAEAGIGAEVTELPPEELFTERVPGGDFDLVLYALPATAFPATDAAPLYTKPQAVPGGQLPSQNHTRVGTDYLDQLLAQAAAELDDGERERLLNQADARIWALGASLPLYQRPQLVAARDDLAGVGAYGLATPRFQDIGYRR